MARMSGWCGVRGPETVQMAGAHCRLGTGARAVKPSQAARDDSTGGIGGAVRTDQRCIGVGVPWAAEWGGANATQALSKFCWHV